MRRLHSGCALPAMAAMLVAAGGALGQPENPTFWVQAPEHYFGTCPDVTLDPAIWGAAASDPRFNLNVLLDISYPDHRCVFEPLTGADAADKVFSRLSERPRDPGRLGLMLVRLGTEFSETAGDTPRLYFHPDDGLAPAYRGFVTHWWATPWMSHGITETTAWTQDFTTEYLARQAGEFDPGPHTPDPNRFIMDNESDLVFDDSPWIVAWMFADSSRWSTEVVPGSGGRTMAQLQTDDDFHAFNYDDPDDPDNLLWWRWYRRVCREAISGANKAAVYDVLKQAWPNVKCSNYAYYSADGADGVGVSDKPPFGPRDYCGHDFADNPRIDFHGPVKAAEDLQAPTFYAPAILVGPGPDYLPSQQRYVRYQLETIQQSFSGVNRYKISPWTHLVGQMSSLPATDSLVPVNLTRTKAWSRSDFAMFRAKRVMEINVFAPGDLADDSSAFHEQDWIDTFDVVQQVWAFDMTLAWKGAAETVIAPQYLWYSDWNKVAESETAPQVIARFELRDGVDLPAKLHVNAESHGTAAGEVASDIEVLNDHQVWTTLSGSGVVSGGEALRWIQSLDVPGDPASWVQPDGAIYVRVRHHQTSDLGGNVESWFDLVQLIGTD